MTFECCHFCESSHIPNDDILVILISCCCEYQITTTLYIWDSFDTFDGPHVSRDIANYSHFIKIPHFQRFVRSGVQEISDAFHIKNLIFMSILYYRQLLPLGLGQEILDRFFGLDGLVLSS
jgi:hypothetical protein